MKRFSVPAGLAILICLSLLAFSQPVLAQMTVGAQLGYGSASYSKVLGEGPLETAEWSACLTAGLSHEDLLFTGLFQYAHALDNTKLARSLVQVAANYLFLEQEALRVYAGLGYQFLSNSFEHPDLEGGVASSLSGSGFVGQAVVDIAITDQIRSQAVITGNPWLAWSFHQTGITDSNLDPGASFAYLLDITYDFSDDLGLYFGLLGGNYKVPAFKEKGETKASSTAVNLGVTMHF